MTDSFTNPKVKIFTDLPALASAAAEQVIQAALLAVQTKGRFSLCLSGGNTPRSLYSVLASPGYLSVSTGQA